MMFLILLLEFNYWDLIEILAFPKSKKPILSLQDFSLFYEACVN